MPLAISYKAGCGWLSERLRLLKMEGRDAGCSLLSPPVRTGASLKNGMMLKSGTRNNSMRSKGGCLTTCIVIKCVGGWGGPGGGVGGVIG